MKGVAMPRRNSNALGKPQGVKKKVIPMLETPVFKRVTVPLSIGSRIDDDTIAALKAVFSK
jgi:hypothetical protein